MSQNWSSSFFYDLDNLFAGVKQPVTKKITIASGAGVLTRGSVLGKVTATGEYILSIATAVDGSQVPDCILSEDIDASTEAIETIAYFAGEFNQNALTLGSGHSVDSIWEGLRAKGIYLKESLKTDGTYA